MARIRNWILSEADRSHPTSTSASCPHTVHSGIPIEAFLALSGVHLVIPHLASHPSKAGIDEEAFEGFYNITISVSFCFFRNIFWVEFLSYLPYIGLMMFHRHCNKLLDHLPLSILYIYTPPQLPCTTQIWFCVSLLGVCIWFCFFVWKSVWKWYWRVLHDCIHLTYGVCIVWIMYGWEPDGMMARVASARLILFTHAAAGPSHPTSNYYQSIASFTVYLTALSSTIR